MCALHQETLPTSALLQSRLSSPDTSRGPRSPCLAPGAGSRIVLAPVTAELGRLGRLLGPTQHHEEEGAEAEAEGADHQHRVASERSKLRARPLRKIGEKGKQGEAGTGHVQ
ncbi:hypothetical protein DL765_010852 [Monosporascus sp. GIB2]|nr:hypothetical protein DL765_010852 [Monosporascus sp. GIB2]